MWFLCSLKQCDVICLKISVLAQCFFWGGCVCVSVWERTRLNYPLVLYSLLILIISGDLHWKAYRCRTCCFPQRLYSIIDTVLKFSPETHIFSSSWCFLINYYKALSSNIWVDPKCYPVRIERSIFWNALPTLTKLSANHILDGLIWLKLIINYLFSLNFGCTTFYACACALNVKIQIFEHHFLRSASCSTFSPG